MSPYSAEIEPNVRPVAISNVITRAQYSVLLTVVVLSAMVPTLIAQRLYQPTVIDVEEEEALGAEDASIGHHA